MIRSKFVKAFILGICISVLPSASAFAETGAGHQAVTQAVSQAQQAASESVLLEKQKEIDQYVFDKHAAEIADKGFTVTNTGAVGNFVEIGITPYSEENADYLYGIFGRDTVKVVEGQQAQTLGLAADNGVMEVKAVNNTAMPEDASGIDPQIIIALACAAGVAVLGSALVVVRRRKTANR